MLLKFLSSAVSGLFLVLIRIYQLTLSSVMGRRCRYLPTCSEYASDAIKRHGPWAGFWLALGRVASCHPWGGHGYDGVPENLPPRIWMFWRQRHGDQNQD
ncbi:MAG: membrane protein insertion efficiency factor YidD [Alphaproteobacteria bacterium]|nr:membrane protein insertion efficiency factor YidD [Alphaproteobacteria bacterium]